MGKRVLENFLQHGDEHQHYCLQDRPETGSRVDPKSLGSPFCGLTLLAPCLVVPDCVSPGSHISHQAVKPFPALGINEIQPAPVNLPGASI